MYFEESTFDNIFLFDSDWNLKHSIVKIMREREYFGELALMYNSTRRATAFSSTDLYCLTLNKESFNVVQHNLIKTSI